MHNLRTLRLVSLTAVFLPAILLISGVALHRHADETVGTTVLLILLNWATLVSPQLLVLILAWTFPALRQRFAVIGLITLTVLLVPFLLVVSISDPNVWMLLGFYFPLSAFAMIVVAFFFVPQGGLSRGSNNRWRGP